MKLKDVCRRQELGTDAKLLLEGRNPKTKAYMEKPMPFREEDNHTASLDCRRWQGIVGRLADLREDGQNHDG